MRLTWSCAGPMQTVRETRYGAFCMSLEPMKHRIKQKVRHGRMAWKYYFLNKFNIMQASGIDDPDMRGRKRRNAEAGSFRKTGKAEKETGKGRKKRNRSKAGANGTGQGKENGP